ncbi:hypothetical protein ACODNH_19020 [Haloarcula sp. NS06]|uniref:hypothetical protein n=1 Tax=Haloarcula sp. NS06 TaxID=3409688 RepID=UPI003DA793FE
MNRNQLLPLVIYYIVLLVLVFVILEVSQAVVGEISFWLEMVIILGVVFAYRSIAVRLGLDPSGRE